METKPAPFIAIEGMDGSGKTTLIRRPKDTFGLRSDIRFVFTREPGGTPAAEAVRGILLDGNFSADADGETQLLGFFYARAHHLKAVRKWRKGQVVITDRFDGSTFAYQVAAQSKSPKEFEELDDLFWTLRNNLIRDEDEPTLYLFLDLPPQTAYARRRADASQERNHYDEKPLRFYERQRDGYEEFFSEIRRRGHSAIARIDATKPPENVLEEARRIILGHVRPSP